MKPAAAHALLRVALAIAATTVPPAAAQTLEPPGKVAEAYERNAAGERLDGERVWDGGGSAYAASFALGDGTNVFGEPALASSFVNDAGTFWAFVNADRNDGFTDRGNGEAATTLAYLVHKSKDEPGELTLHFTGGRLQLRDYGGGTTPLEAAVLLQVWFRKDGEDTTPDEFYATLTGRGGSTANETFEWTQQQFDVTEASYTESGSGNDVFEAELIIPPKTVTYGLEFFCEECTFEFWVELSVIANNPGGETTAYAAFRDPVHVDDADPIAGSAWIEFDGVTLLPSPEPVAAAADMATFAALCAVRRRRYAPAGSARPIRSSKFST